MEQNENQVWNDGEDWLLCMTPWQLEESGRQPAAPVSTESCQIDDLSHLVQAWENPEQRHRERTGDQLPKDMRLAILLSMCPTDLEKELTSQQHLFPNYAQTKAHIVTVINSRTRGLAGNLSDDDSNHPASSHASDESVQGEEGELYRLEIRNGKKVFTKSSYSWSKGYTKGGEKGKTDRECYRCGRVGHIRTDCRVKSHINGGPPKSAPKGKGVASYEDEETEISQNLPLGTIDIASFEVLSDHGDNADDEVDVDVSTDETTEMMPPLPPVSWFKKTKMYCGKFGNPCNKDHRDEEYPFFDCQDEMREQLDILKQVDPWARNAPRFVPHVKSCSSVNFTACSVCQKLGLYQFLPTQTPQYDIFSEEEERLSNDSTDGEWCSDDVDLNTVTIDNMTIDSTADETDGKRGRYREITVDSGARESVVLPDDWPSVDLKPSKGSVKGQRYVGPGGERIDNLVELTEKVRAERHGGGDISSRVKFQGAKFRKPLLAVFGVIDKDNIVVFDGNGSFILPNSCAGVASVRKAISAVQGRIPLHAKNGVFVLRT